MNGYKTEEAKRDICKNHTTRCDRDSFRVCPSKLSKRELEDLYFTLLENNVDLKRTINGQQDKIKLLSTKVQRMTVAQKSTSSGRENECCNNIKSMVNEQKQSIADLKKANERMSERIRVLNMRLCSAKQFLRRSPVPSASRCAKCSAPPTFVKNSSVSIINAKGSDSNVKSAAASSQYLDKDVALSTRTVETETGEQEKEDPERICKENKCQSLIEELKQKVVNLQEELSKSHDEYTSRISHLETEVSELRTERERALAQRASGAQQLQQRAEQLDQLGARLRAAEAQYGDLAMELSIEKRKVAELETRLKAVDMSCAVAKTIEGLLKNNNQVRHEEDSRRLDVLGTPDVSPRDKSYSRLKVPGETRGVPSDATDQVDPSKAVTSSDDSGFVPDSPDDKVSKKNLKEVLYDRITCLQDQLEKLKLAAAAEKSDKKDSPKPGPNKALLFESDPGGPRRESPPKTNPSSVVRGAKKLSKITEPAPSPTSDVITPLKTDLDKPEESKLNTGEGKVKSTPSQSSPERTLHSVSINTDPKRILSDDKDPEEGCSKGNNENRKSVYSANLEEEQPEKKRKSAKGDAHNSMQIPGPLPVEDVVPGSPSKITERNKKRRRSSDGIKKPAEVKKDSTDSAISHVREVISLDEPSLTAESKEKAANEKKELEERTNGSSAKKEPKNIFIDGSSHALRQKRSLKSTTAISQATQSCTGTERILLLAAPSGTVDSALIKVAGPSLTEKYDDELSECVTPTSENTCEFPGARLADAGVNVAPQPVVDSGVQATNNGNGNIELCATHARVCTCPRVPARRREVSVFRTCSGTLRFRTEPAPLAACACADQARDTPSSRDTDTQTYDEPCKEDDASSRRSVTYSKKEQRTYSLPPRSPDNTDCGISSLSDLPSERDGKTPRVLSPGEERQTSTFTEYTAPTSTEYGSLSEGELPGAGGVGRRSFGEAKVNFHDAKHAAATNTKTGNAGMSPCIEDTLAAITQELALCRDLLQARRSEQAKPSKDASQMADLNPGPIALKRAAASPRIGDAFTPKCIFTLHIGTVVLSDEAVINSRNLSLVLTWRFYDQNVTMTRMRAGRVVLFDFSTEYDVKITDQFLHYLKHEEMQLVICELDNQWEPFATCALRLRDALLHTNRRADMSLALVAGPQLRRARAARDALDAGDEVGVLDVWCMLRVDPALLPAINRAIAKSVPLTGRRKSASIASHSGSRNNSAGLALVTEDDRSTDDRLSQDLTIASHTQPKHSVCAYDYDKRPVPDNSSVGSQTRRPAPDQQPQPRPPESINSQERFSQTPVSPEQRGQVGFKKDTENIDKDTQSVTSCPSKITSKVIVNETAKIRSAYEMKQALEETGSQTHSNASSWRGLVTRRLIPKGPKKSSATSVRTEQRGTFPSFFKYYNKDNNMSRSSKHSKGYTASEMHPSADLEDPPELTRAQRADNCSKKSVTYNDWTKENNNLYFESNTNQNEAAIGQNIEITIMWLALNEECDAMTNANVQRLYVAYNFLGRSGADLETPVSLPKPATYGDKCYFHFTKTFQLNDCDLPLLGHMAKCRSTNSSHDPRDCVVFTVISEPPEDPLGLDSCQDIGYAYLYLGDLVEYSAGSDTYTEVVAVLSAQERDAVCGVLAVRVDGLDVVRRCLALAGSCASVDAA